MEKKLNKTAEKLKTKKENERFENFFDFLNIEKKWQKAWETHKIFEVKENSGKKYYVLEMYPYPSASGLHMGHALNYTIGDIYARFKKMRGYNVLHPMGFDSFGLPAENAAIKAKAHPKKFTEDAIKNFIRQQKSLGISYDWSRAIMSHDPSYYKWDQWIFLKMLEKGLAYKKKALVNWCPDCGTVLANEQVRDGFCWRHKQTKVELKHLEQWFFKITNYANELYDSIDRLKEWPERIKLMQKNWIGKSHGTEIMFEITSNLNFLQLHGWEANSNKDFHPWLEKELRKKGYSVETPNLPNTYSPNVEEQVEYVLKNYKINKNTVLVGHSLGCPVALKILERLNKPIKKLILTAGFIDLNFKHKKVPFEKNFPKYFDFNKIKNNVKEVLILRAKNDSFIPKNQADFIKEKIGGTIIDFTANADHICGKEEPEVLNACIEKWPIFTTRPDTIYGVTFMVISAQHPKLMNIITEKQETEMKKFLKKIKSTSEKDIKLNEELDKEGAFTGSYAINPITKERVPIWAGNFVLPDYGSGMVMAVPSHDQRDFDFAKKYKIPMKEVIQAKNAGFMVVKKSLPKEKFAELNKYGLKIKISEKQPEQNIQAYTGEGILINSDKFNGLESKKAIEEITRFLEKQKLGKKTTNFKLRDWLISRQRFWGTPIPVVYCEKCGIVPVPETDLPVLLPENIKFISEKNPLIDYEPFVKTKCPKCKGNARRETDTMDTFVNSSWYFLRYSDPNNNKEIFNKNKAKYWTPIDVYIGGAEHACMHLIYFRFYTKFLRDIGLLKIDEPAKLLFNQGMLHGEDGAVMSKSRGNVILPEEVSKKYGIDAARLFLISMASPDKDISWSTSGIEGSLRLINKIINYFSNINHRIGKSSLKLESKTNKSVKEITQDIELFKYNLAVIKIRQLFEVIEQEAIISKQDIETFLKILSPFCPHITEELWQRLGNKTFIALEQWPKVQEYKIDNKIEKEEFAVQSLIEDIKNIIKIVKEKQKKEIGRIFVYTIPNELQAYSENKIIIEKNIGIHVDIFAVNDKNKYDPQQKAQKAKPGKPAIYVE